ncbi:MAG: hypothetical protein AAB588_03315 [Patescibacteria group bacterium]
MENNSHNNGSALLIALVLMGILMSLSIGISGLLIGALRDSTLLVQKTKAWYAAESATEHALLDIAQNPPGFETTQVVAPFGRSNGLASPRLGLVDSEVSGVRGEYQIKARSREIPNVPAYQIQSDSDRYAVLRYNESITIPLFSGPSDGETIKQFRVNYYFSPDLALRGEQVSNNLDILRWKIFGIAHDGTMEVMSEFFPADKGNSAAAPTCLGTNNQCYNYAKFYERAPDGFHIVEQYAISTFLEQHTQNFLVLTNITNVDLIAGSLSTAEKQDIANIRYRVIVEDSDPKAQLTLPSIQITADGFAGTAKQSLDLTIPRDSFLPVFNYALYRTAE